MNKCPKCGELENFHYNYDYSKAERPVLDILCNECGEFFPPVLKLPKQKVMKNIHVIETDKPSRLHLWTDENGTRLELCELEYSHTRNTKNIYITNDEEIKDGDWFVVKLFKITGESDGLHIEKCTKLDNIWCNNFDVISTRHKNNCKKIILTTDQNLINDGIEQISEDTLLKIVEHINSGKNIESFDEL